MDYKKPKPETTDVFCSNCSKPLKDFEVYFQIGEANKLCGTCIRKDISSTMNKILESAITVI